MNDGLVGNTTEVDIQVDNTTVRALLDTGASVSLVSQSFYDSHLSHITIQPLDYLLEIEHAGGNSLPYSGFIEVDVKAIGCGLDSSARSCLLLVVPDTRYNCKVPVLLGTNVLSHLLEECKVVHGARFLQKADLFTPWYLAYRCLSICAKELSRNGGKLGLVKSAEYKSIAIPANSSVTIKGQLHRGVPYRQVCALLQPTLTSAIPGDLDIAPTLVNYDYTRPDEIEVLVSNVTTQTAIIRPRDIMCELQPVTIEDLSSGKPVDSDSLLDQVEFDTDGLSQDQITLGLDFIRRFSQIFSTGDADLGHSTMVRHRIELDNDIPFKQRHRRIPPSMYDEITSHLKDLLSAGVIRQSHSPWTSNVVLVKRKDGRLRICIDYRELNRRTIKDSYALPRIEELLDCLGGMRFFSVLDMKSGYHQVEMAEEHKQRTAFTVGPLGFFEYNRMPFGLSNAPATYQRLMETSLQGLHLKICLVYIDDLIIFSKTYEEHLERLELVFRRLQECGLKLAPKKCKFFKRKVRYVGYIVSADGIEADPDKIDKIKQWPTPKTPEEVRRFLGFAGYYRKFVKDFSKIAKPLSELLPKTASKKSRYKKNSAVDWK